MTTSNKRSNVEEINRFYDNNEEALALAKEAIKEVQEIEDRNKLSSDGGKMDWRGRNGGVKTIAVAISDQFMQQGYIDHRNQKINSPQDLALLAQIYRDPRYETLRFFYMNGDTIVGHEGITSKLPSACVGFLGLPDKDNFQNDREYLKHYKSAHTRFFMQLLNRMERLGADGYYLLHNHPSAISVNPSSQDIELSKTYKKALYGFKGHIIINSNKFCYIDTDISPTVYPLNLGADKLTTPSLPHPLLNTLIDNPVKLAQIAKEIQLDHDYSVMVYLSAKNHIRAIQEVPNGLFKHEKGCIDFLRGQMFNFGSSAGVIITGDPSINKICAEYVKKGYILDALFTDPIVPFLSVRESGINKTSNDELFWMGKKALRGVKVNDEKNIYPSKNNLGDLSL